MVSAQAASAREHRACAAGALFGATLGRLRSRTGREEAWPRSVRVDRRAHARHTPRGIRSLEQLHEPYDPPMTVEDFQP